MAKACCVDGCIAKDVIYFRFPNSRMRCKKWMEAVKLSTKPNHNSVVCSAHFSTEDYALVRGKYRLKAKVVPSLLRPEPQKSRSTFQNSHIDTRADNTGRTEKNRIENISPNSNCDGTVRNGKYPGSASNKRTATVATGNLKNGANRSKKTKRRASLSKGRKRKARKESESLSQAIKPPARHEGSEKQEDIEEMLTFYHIKQNRDVAARQNAEFEREKIRQSGNEKGEEGSERGKSLETETPSKEVELDPVFIEIDVNKDKPNGRGSGSSRDCLMVMESVQVECDPSDLMPPEGEEPESIVIDDGPYDPISLLTSSDEDDVILQEPKIDTVVVSDESDPDDRPLGNAATALLVCSSCGYSTASAAQLSKHRKKHKAERRFECRVCDYRAKHRMSLMYHLRSHDRAETPEALPCGN